MTTLTPEQQFAESCGSLDTFTAHGHTSAWGLFAYPDDEYTEQIQTDVVSTCFAFGRTYDDGVSSARALDHERTLVPGHPRHRRREVQRSLLALLHDDHLRGLPVRVAGRDLGIPGSRTG
jgi:hypothetical protein